MLLQYYTPTFVSCSISVSGAGTTLVIHRSLHIVPVLHGQGVKVSRACCQQSLGVPMKFCEIFAIEREAEHGEIIRLGLRAANCAHIECHSHVDWFTQVCWQGV